ncbi:LysM peptidoglycan-binding domain-containing protein [Candidatus Uhrbacteria bacterium]|nr:LysM peptidoglycan-binding domain-containing protein [Candidatus Uhrbacteria bacterium]
MTFVTSERYSATGGWHVIALLTGALLAIAAVFVLRVPRAAAAMVESDASMWGGSSLGELIVLEGLFNDNGKGDGVLSGSTSGRSGLAKLVALQGLFNGGGRTVVVESGDTLAGIAQTFLGSASRFSEIVAWNGIANPNRIFPGQRLRLPANGGGMTGTSGLGELIVLDSLFHEDGDDDAEGGTSDLGELIILDRLFGNGGGLFR